MNYIDVILVAGLALGFGLGVVTGLVMQLAGMLSLAVGVAVTLLFSPLVADALGRWTDNRSLAMIVASLGLFAAAGMAVRLLLVLFSHFLKTIHLGKLDKLLGGLAGMAKFLVIGAVLVVVLGRYGKPATQAEVRGSVFGGLAVGTTDYLLGKADASGLAETAKETLAKSKAAAEKLREEGVKMLDQYQNGEASTTKTRSVTQPATGSSPEIPADPDHAE